MAVSEQRRKALVEEVQAYVLELRGTLESPLDEGEARALGASVVAVVLEGTGAEEVPGYFLTDDEEALLRNLRAVPPVLEEALIRRRGVDVAIAALERLGRFRARRCEELLR